MPELTSPSPLWPAFEREGVKPLVLRDFERLPDFITGGDIDLALEDRSQLPAAERAIRAFAAESDLEVALLLRHSYVWEFKLRGRNSSLQFIVDVHTGGEGWRGPFYLTTRQLFAGARDAGLWWTPAPEHQAMMAVFQHLLWGGFYKEKYHALVPRWIAGHEEAFRVCVAEAFGEDIAARLVEMVLAADANGLAALVPELRRRLWKYRGLPDLPGAVGRLVAFVWDELAITFRRYGRWVVFVGPDGVGKTTVAGLLLTETKDLFRGVRYHHWIPRWQKPLSPAVPASAPKPPLREQPTGASATILSAVRLVRNVLRAHLAYWLRIVPHLLRQRLVIGDRYLFNYHLDPVSVRYYGPPSWVRWALRLVPKPDIVLCLYADPAEIHRRKPELSLDEIRRVISRAQELPGLGFHAVQIPAEDGPDAVVRLVAVRVTQTLHEPRAESASHH